MSDYFQVVQGTLKRSDDKKTIISGTDAAPFNAFSSIIVDTSKTNAIYSWTIKINKTGLELVIGIVTSDYIDTSNYRYESSLRYCYDVDGQIYVSADPDVFHTTESGVHDAIAFKLDTQKMTVSLYRNHVLIHTQKDIKQSKYKLGIAMAGDDSYGAASVTMTKYKVTQMNKEETKQSNDAAVKDDGMIAQLLQTIEKQNEEINRLKASSAAEIQQLKSTNSKLQQV